MADDRGWDGDAEGHREARERRDEGYERTRTKTNWWPLLFLPVAFIGGWAMGDASDSNDNRQSYTNQAQPGVGGGPDVSVTPSVNSTVTPGTVTDPEEDQGEVDNDDAQVSPEATNVQ